MTALNPMKYTGYDLGAVAVAVAGVLVAALTGHDELYGLVLALAVPGRKTALRVRARPRKKKPGPNLPLLLLALLALGGCTSVTTAYLLDSRDAALAVASDYLTGCEEVDLGPLFRVDWSGSRVAYAGGLVVGCMDSGRLVTLVCRLVPAAAGETRTSIACEPLESWVPEVEAP
jgi:hypothetical protein